MTKKAHAKINTFLKITGYKNGYHTLLSRFVKVPNLYDTISFVPQKCNSFTIEGCGDIPTTSNIIYKAYKAMNIDTDFFKYHKVVVEKNIPSGAGLGGGSSDGGTFMRLFNEVCNLQIDIATLADIGSTVGADIPFFVYNYDSANVSGFGEIVKPFEEEIFDIELYTPNLHCDTSLVYKTFKQNIFDSIDLKSFKGWEELTSKEILSKVDAVKANDLYRASLIAYPELKDIAPKEWYFSGSGSTFFKI
ncbi:MAG: 4-(cytidine 5'-diphospho)-2-C-methyl-D-erythritol kinase [Sulfurovaceae bacterium]|nr:4-(cytidine 5'-diphospho)-2-C-methyl-D-erythritol kinase [Sulfurovaceae bacterium]